VKSKNVRISEGTLKRACSLAFSKVCGKHCILYCGSARSGSMAQLMRMLVSYLGPDILIHSSILNSRLNMNPFVRI